MGIELHKMTRHKEVIMARQKGQGQRMDQIRFVLPADEKAEFLTLCKNEGYNMSAVLRNYVKKFVEAQKAGSKPIEKPKKERTQT